MANIVRLDIMQGKPRSFVCPNMGLENGYLLEIVGKTKDVVEGVDFDVYEVRLAEANSNIGNVLFHASVENMYDERMMKQDFVLEAGKVGRGYFIERGDIVTIPAHLTNANAIGQRLVLGGGGELEVTNSTKAIAIVEAFEDIVIQGAEAQESIVIRFL